MNGCIEIFNMKYHVTNGWTNKTFAPNLKWVYVCQNYFFDNNIGFEIIHSKKHKPTKKCYSQSHSEGLGGGRAAKKATGR
jgi:hypothetical protein